MGMNFSPEAVAAEHMKLCETMDAAARAAGNKIEAMGVPDEAVAATVLSAISSVLVAFVWACHGKDKEAAAPALFSLVANSAKQVGLIDDAKMTEKPKKRSKMLRRMH